MQKANGLHGGSNPHSAHTQDILLYFGIVIGAVIFLSLVGIAVMCRTRRNLQHDDSHMTSEQVESLMEENIQLQNTTEKLN